MNSLGELVDRGKTENWGRYRLFGLTLGSNYTFDGRLPPSEGEIDITFACVDQRPIYEAWENTSPTYISPRVNLDGESIFKFYRTDDYQVAHYPDIVDFYLYEQGVICHLLNPAQEELATSHILPAIVSLWLELYEDLYALHASAVCIEGQAIGFLGDSGHGKSTLAAAFTQADYPLLSDDILLIGEKSGSFLARPGYPMMRLWMNEAKHFIPDPENLEIIQAGYDKRRVPVGGENYGRFYDQLAPLTCVYIPQRHPIGDEAKLIQIEDIPPRDAVIELVRLAYSSRLSEALGRNAQRLGFFARMAAALPLRRLVYPSDYADLPAVRSAILDDIGAEMN